MMKQFALGVKVGRTKKSIFDAVWRLCLYSLLKIWEPKKQHGDFRQPQNYLEEPQKMLEKNLAKDLKGMSKSYKNLWKS